MQWLGNESIDMVITSPPYYNLRDYGVSGQLGSEPTFREYLDKLIAIFAEVKRVLKDTGSVWVNLGDTYSRETKSLLCIPDRFKIRMIDELGFVCRNDLIWYKPNAMPQSAKDRFSVDYERILFFTKSERYYFEQQYQPLSEQTLAELDKAYRGKSTKDYASAAAQDAGATKRRIVDSKIRNAIAMGWQPETQTYAEWYFNARQKKSWHDHQHDQEQGFGQQTRGQKPNTIYHPLGSVKRSVWRVPVKPFKEAHFATFPETLIETPILAGCPLKGIVLDPFMGAGTTAIVAKKLGRDYLGIELKADYIAMAEQRLAALS